MRVLRWVKRLFLLMLLVVICAGGVVAGRGYQMYRAALGEMSLEDKVAVIRENPEYTKIDELPTTYLNAVVSVEDHRFYRHPGIDPIAITRAVINDIKAGAFIEGGSTITQQLAKNMYFTQEKKITRKAAEAFMAFNIERNYSKDEILELYVNHIYFGDGYTCVGEASRGYFGKEPKDMTDYESTLLAGIPNAPSAYSPTENPKLARERQQQVLSRMVAAGYYSEEDAKTVGDMAGD